MASVASRGFMGAALREVGLSFRSTFRIEPGPIMVVDTHCWDDEAATRRDHNRQHSLPLVKIPYFPRRAMTEYGYGSYAITIFTYHQ